MHGGLVDTVAGAYDHAYGSFDESVGRQFDDEKGGGTFDGRSQAWEPSDGLGNRWLRGKKARAAYDLVFQYDQTLNGEKDTRDLFGSAAWGHEGSVFDVLEDKRGEDKSGDKTGKRWVTGAAIVGAVLVVTYLLAQVATVTSAVSGDA